MSVLRVGKAGWKVWKQTARENKGQQSTAHNWKMLTSTRLSEMQTKRSKAPERTSPLTSDNIE